MTAGALPVMIAFFKQHSFFSDAIFQTLLLGKSRRN
jgi:hypothetical protein